jgi:hypothetical protein
MTPHHSNIILSDALMLISKAQDDLCLRCCCRR